MVILKIALRSLLRRKSRALTIGVLVAFGTLLLVFGQTFTRSAGIASRESIINNFTGDLILYSERSKEKPSPFAFNTPLPVIAEVERIRAYLEGLPEVEAVVPFAQNYALIQTQKDGKAVELPFIFYAIEPASYREIFRNVEMRQGDFFGVEGGTPRQGILISEFQNAAVPEELRGQPGGGPGGDGAVAHRGGFGQRPALRAGRLVRAALLQERVQLHQLRGHRPATPACTTSPAWPPIPCPKA